VQIAGGTYHVTTRGNRRQPIYHDDFDRRLFLAFGDRVIRRCGWRMEAFCLMTTHFHLLIETPQPNLSIGMHLLNGGYAAYFNERYDFDGHLFEKRFGSRLVESDEDLHGVLRYIAYNPVEAGLCEHPWQWPWSSFHGANDIAF
jgi:putative transposase